MNPEIMPESSSRPGRKTKIKRVRTGCFTCRSRKKKCDEKKPSCAACVRNRLVCRWPRSTQRHAYREEYSEAECSPRTPACSIGESASIPTPPLIETLDTLPFPAVFPTDIANGPALHFPGEDEGLGSSSSSSLSSIGDFTLSLPDHIGSPILRLGETLQESRTVDQNSDGETISLELAEAPSLAPPILTVGLSFRGLSDIQGTTDNQRFELLGHYLTVTAHAMSNGTMSSNPFLSQLVPLAFSSNLILQLLLAQSAAHRAIRDQENTALAQTCYFQSVRLFRKTVDDYIRGVHDDPIPLMVGALIMCFTETAGGDVDGAVFDHLLAADSLLVRTLSPRNLKMPHGLREFLIEYFIYTATLSIISTDATQSTRCMVSPQLEECAQDLVRAGYVGNLCGCWLDLLVEIPKIFAFATRVLSRDKHQDGVNLSAEEVAAFASLQNRVLTWAPNESTAPDLALTGTVFQYSILLYLYTSLSLEKASKDSVLYSLIQDAAAKVLLLLEQLPVTSAANTNLCWPIAVVGACIEDESQREVLKTRLQFMECTVGLGNIYRTRVILEECWKLPSKEVTPWTICRVMLACKIHISFA